MSLPEPATLTAGDATVECDCRPTAKGKFVGVVHVGNPACFIHGRTHDASDELRDALRDVLDVVWYSVPRVKYDAIHDGVKHLLAPDSAAIGPSPATLTAGDATVKCNCRVEYVGTFHGTPVIGCFCGGMCVCHRRWQT